HIRSHRHESSVPQGELAGVAVDQIEAHRKDDVDADAQENVQVVRVEARGHQRNQNADTQCGKQQAFDLHQTFSTSALPSNPDGLNSRMKIRSAKAMASR